MVYDWLGITIRVDFWDPLFNVLALLVEFGGCGDDTSVVDAAAVVVNRRWRCQLGVYFKSQRQQVPPSSMAARTVPDESIETSTVDGG